MSTTVYIQLSIEIAGDNAGDAARVLQERIEDGRMDLVSINLLREELRHVAGDWRITRAETGSAELIHEVTP